ncbi:MAG: replicative DNA helicase [Endomicrobium sp.]|jgi:replicative DNA helicase|nr:replicative DNA helicase [Endomicrobium sp.]
MKLIPQAVDVEMAVLGSMFIDQEIILKIFDLLSVDDLYSKAHKLIFSTIYELYIVRKIPIDIFTVSNILKTNDLFINIGGTSYLVKLTDTTQTIANVESYITIIKEKAILRRIINAGHLMIDQALSEQKSIDEILNESQSALFNIFTQYKNNKNQGCIQVTGFVRPLLKSLEEIRCDSTKLSGLSTGFKYLDIKTTGFQPSELIIIAARPSMGKTALALNIAEHVAIYNRKPVGIFSLETNRTMVILRMLSSLARINTWNLRNGQYSQHDWTKLNEAAKKISTAPIFIDDDANITVMEIEVRARKLATELYNQGTPLSLLIIDYIQFIRGHHYNKFSNRQQEVSDISRALKSLAKDLNIPVVVLSQLSRKPEDQGRKNNTPQLSDLRDSGAIEQDADLVMMLYREGYYNRDNPDIQKKATLIIAKQRNGPVANIPLIFEGEYTKFSSEYITQDE